MHVIVQGLDVGYDDSGSQASIVLYLHGWGSNKESFAALEPAFAGYRVIALDLPGFGASQPPVQAWDVAGYAGFVSNFLEKVRITEVAVVIGHSFGGRIALELIGGGLLSPGKLILLGSHGLPEPMSAKGRLISQAARAAKFLPHSVRNRAGRRFASADYKASSGIMREVFIKVINQDARLAATRITVPTLLVYGELDTTTPPDFGQKFNELIPGSELAIIPDSGHYVHIDNPRAVSTRIKEFLRK